MAKATMVGLKSKDRQKNQVSQKFEITQANRLLSLQNTQWELSDANFEWNGTEIVKKGK